MLAALRAPLRCRSSGRLERQAQSLLEIGILRRELGPAPRARLEGPVPRRLDLCMGRRARRTRSRTAAAPSALGASPRRRRSSSSSSRSRLEGQAQRLLEIGVLRRATRVSGTSGHAVLFLTRAQFCLAVVLGASSRKSGALPARPRRRSWKESSRFSFAHPEGSSDGLRHWKRAPICSTTRATTLSPGMRTATRWRYCGTWSPWSDAFRESSAHALREAGADAERRGDKGPPRSVSS